MRAASGRDQYRKKTPSAKAGDVWTLRSSPIETPVEAQLELRNLPPRSRGSFTNYRYVQAILSLATAVRGAYIVASYLLARMHLAWYRYTAMQILP